MKKFNLIVAATEKGLGIGKDGTIPWRLPNEMKYFKQITTSKEKDNQNAVIMGRKTWESIPEKNRPLPNRINIVLSSKKEIEGAKVVPDFTSALNMAMELKASEIFIIGGEEVYKEAMSNNNCDKIYLTKILKEFECDKFFPKIDLKKFELDEKYFENETFFENEVPYKYYLYQKIEKKHEEYQYLELIKDIFENGIFKEDRTGLINII
jgi:dihydrofolate reductase